MNVWKKQSVKYLKDGKRCAKGAKGARKAIIESKRFYGTLRTASGKRKQVPLTEDQKTSETLLHRLQGEADKRRALGITEEDERRSTSIEPMIVRYEEYLTIKGVTEDHSVLKGQRLRKLFTAAKMNTLSDLDSIKVLRMLGG